MTESFHDPGGDPEPEDQAPALPEPDVLEEQPIGADEPLPADAGEQGPALDAPARAEEPATPAGGPEPWHSDPEAGDELLAWLDAEPPSLDPPPDLDSRLAEALAGEAAREGRDPAALVRDVLDRLRER